MELSRYYNENVQFIQYKIADRTYCTQDIVNKYDKVYQGNCFKCGTTDSFIHSFLGVQYNTEGLVRNRTTVLPKYQGPISVLTIN